MGNINAFKKNKNTSILSYDIAKIKYDYFCGGNANSIAEKYGYSKGLIRKYLDGAATVMYTNSKGQKHRRCSICRNYREVKYFGTSINKKNNKTYYRSSCRTCDNNKRRNNNIVEQFKKGREIVLSHKREIHNKYAWKYNIRKRLLRIMGELDSKGRRILFFNRT